MPTLTVNGHSVTVDGSFAQLSPQEQNAAVEEIAKSLPEEKPSGVVAGFKEGLSNLIHGPAETLKTFGGLDTSAVEKGAQAVAPKDYKSAPILGPDSHWYDPRTYNLKNIPQMLAENAPQMAEGMAGAKVGARVGGMFGPVGSAVGGAIGGVAPFVLNTLGDTAKSAAVTRTGDANAEANTDDKIRAGLTVGAQSIPQALGVSRLVNPGSVASVGLKGAATSVGKGVVTTGIEGATGAATNAIGQAGATLGTEGGLKIDPNAVAEAGVGNAITGGVLQSPKMLSNIAEAKKYARFGGDNADATKAFAQSVLQAADGDNLKNTRNGYKAVRQAHEDTLSRLKDAADAAGPATPEVAAVLARAGKGRVLSDDDHSTLSSGSTPEVADLARQAHVGAMLKQLGDFTSTGDGEGRFTGGIANSVGKNVRAIQNPSGAAISAGLGATIGGAHAASLFAYSPETLGAIGAAYGVMRGVDALTGNRSPAQQFVSKFGSTGPSVPPTAQQPPQAAPAGPGPSVPQVAPPAAPSQPWGAPKPAGPEPLSPQQLNEQVKSALLMAAARRKVAAQQAASSQPPGIDVSAVNEQIKGALLMAAARRKVAEQQAAANAPQPEPGLDVKALNEQVKSALLMASARRKVEGQQQARDEAANSEVINAQGGLDALSNPELGKHAKMLLGNASALAKLRATSEDDAPAEPAPETPAISKTAVQMLKQKLKAGLPPEPEAAPAAPAAVAPPAPTFNPTALAMLKAKLKAGLPKETPELPKDDDNTIPSFLPDRIPSFLPSKAAPPAPAPAALGGGGPTSPQVPVAAPAAVPSVDTPLANDPAVQALIANAKLRHPAALAPATITKSKGGEVEVEDTTQPYPDRVKVPASGARDQTTRDTTKLKGRPLDEYGDPIPFDPKTGEVYETSHEAANSNKFSTGYAPLQDHELYGKNMSHDQFAAHEVHNKLTAGELDEAKAQAYHDAIVMSHKTLEHTIQQLAQSAGGVDDVPALKALLQQLYHTRRSDVAAKAIHHYASFMSPGMRKATLERLDGQFLQHWSKHSKDD